jgi:pentafunctional AROM polypeptide
MCVIAKFGVETKELDDGLEIYGKPHGTLKEGVSVHCYDDHRVAMAFSVLGCLAKGTILEEKRCVEKTWPNWWDDLENKVRGAELCSLPATGLIVVKIGLKVEGVELSGTEGQASGPTRDKDASVVLIGMRGSGKTYIGELAASTLDWGFLDADVLFERKYPEGVKGFVQRSGWPAFRDAETELLKEIIATYPKKHVVSLGGGIVETPAARDALTSYAKLGPVVHIVRHIDEIVTYLGAETSRPAYGEPLANVYRRREPWFSECRTHEFINHTGISVFEGKVEQAQTTFADGTILPPEPARHIRDEVARFFGHVTGTHPNLAPNLAHGKRSYFLSLTFPDYKPHLDKLERLTAGVDAIEVRVDLLRTPEQLENPSVTTPAPQYVADQVAAIRRETAIPIVYTVRTASQGGAFPDNAVKEAFELMELGLRLGVEYLDVEITWPRDRIRELLKKKGCSRVIASWHDVKGEMKWNGNTVESTYDVADEIGDIIKIIGTARVLEDNLDLYAFVKRKTRRAEAKPVLAINMGLAGQMSRILNGTFSPVTHPLMPTKAAPGQLSFKEIQQALSLLGALPPKRFFLFGNPIQQSMSPTLHNTAFEMLGLPHAYGLMETDTIDEQIRFTITAPDFGGASVTIPFKRDIIEHLDELSPEAEAIGAVNTVIPVTNADGAHILRGDNTDWLGMRAVILARLPPSAHTIPAALVIGAGGTARAAIFTLQSLGAQHIYLFNRTRARAEQLVGVVPGANVQVIDALGTWPADAPSVIIGTVPASATTLDADSGDALVLPSSLFSPEGGVVVDMAYRPAETPLLKLARATRSSEAWHTVQGLEVLLEQGYAQFSLWTGRRAPRETVAREVWKKYLGYTE